MVKTPKTVKATASITAQAVRLRRAAVLLKRDGRDPYKIIEHMVIAVLGNEWVDEELQESLLIDLASTVDVEVVERQHDPWADDEEEDEGG
jgi:hypothetical protein